MHEPRQINSRATTNQCTSHDKSIHEPRQINLRATTTNSSPLTNTWIAFLVEQYFILYCCHKHKHAHHQPWIWSQLHQHRGCFPSPRLSQGLPVAVWGLKAAGALVCTCPPAPVPMYAISSCSWKVLGKHTLVYLSSSSCAGVCDKFMFLKNVGQAPSVLKFIF